MDFSPSTVKIFRVGGVTYVRPLAMADEFWIERARTARDLIRDFGLAVAPGDVSTVPVPLEFAVKTGKRKSSVFLLGRLGNGTSVRRDESPQSTRFFKAYIVSSRKIGPNYVGIYFSIMGKLVGVYQTVPREMLNPLGERLRSDHFTALRCPWDEHGLKF